jgi:hypothetical protein
MGAEDPRKGGLSLLEYVRERRRAECSVCALPDALRDQMAKASERKIKRAVVVAWLLDEHGHTITEDDINAHVNGRHDTRAA